MFSAVQQQQRFHNIEEYVEKLGGTRVIKKILIANNGIGAVKAIRSIRRWAFEMFQNEDAVHFVVMATPEDLAANAEYIRMASEVVDVPGGANNNNYANVSLIVELAERHGVDAVWAGWGHASENPTLPESLAKTKKKVKFIGPQGGPMRALGDKIGSTIIAQSAGVPCISWNGDGITIDYEQSKAKGNAVQVPESIYTKASVKTIKECLYHCERIGFPVMIKASEGGGGKGIRKVVEKQQVETAFRQVEAEIPGSPIFVMKLATRARHLEVQLLADEYGEAIALNGRDCSIQRRHQKIIEEGPPLAAPSEIWIEMERAAVALAKAVGYSNAGTVEYLYTGQSNSQHDQGFAFLELNPRLQVEHPVTEMITRINLPACQLMVAMGIRIHRIPDVRRLYSRPPFSTSTIDFNEEPRRPPYGHCIAVRITAENPDQGFQPTSGSITEVNFRSTPDVWGYFSVDSSGLVHEFADSQFGHLFASGADREMARKNMIMALNEISIRGDIRTTVEYVADLLKSKDYVTNHIDTAWLDNRLQQANFKVMDTEKIAMVKKNPGPEIAAALMDSDQVNEDSKISRDLALAATHASFIIAHRTAEAKKNEFTETLIKGHFPDCDKLTATSQRVELILQGHKFVFDVDHTGPYKFAVANAQQFSHHMNIPHTDDYVEGSVRSLADGGYLVTLAGRSRVAYANQPPGQALRLVLDRKTYLFELEYDPATLRADTAGKLAKRLVPDGTHVAAGTAYAELEVMKMYLPLTVGADGAGILTWAKPEGVALEAGNIIATVQLDDPEKISKARLYQGNLRQQILNQEKKLQDDGPIEENVPPHLVLRRATGLLENTLDGFAVPQDQRQRALVDFQTALREIRLARCEIEEALAVLRGRLPSGVDTDLANILKKEPISAEQCLHILNTHAETNPTLPQVAAGLREVLHRYENGGLQARASGAVLELIRRFLKVEREFADGAPLSEIIARLRKAGNDPERIFHVCRSRCMGQDRGVLVLELFLALNSLIKTSSSKHIAADFAPALTELANLRDESSSAVALEARRLLYQQTLPSRDDLVSRISNVVHELSQETQSSKHNKLVADFIRSGLPIRDVAIRFLADEDQIKRITAVELYIKKIYEAHGVTDFAPTRSELMQQGVFATWTFGGLSVVPNRYYTSSNVSAFTTCNDDALAQLVLSSTPRESIADTPTRRNDDKVSNSSSFVDLETLNAVSGITGNATPSKSQQPSPMGDDESVGFNDDHSAVGIHTGYTSKRYGIFGIYQNFQDASQHMDALLKAYPGDEESHKTMNFCLHIAILSRSKEEGDDDLFVERCVSALRVKLDILKNAQVRRVTFLVAAPDDLAPPAIYTFRAKSDFAEDVFFRYIEPPHAYYLDLVRLRNFSIRLADAQQTLLSNVHCYVATPREKSDDMRFFVRSLTLAPDFAASDAERMLVECLAVLELQIGEAEKAQRIQLARETSLTSGKKKGSKSFSTASKSKGLSNVRSKNHVFLAIVARSTLVSPAAAREAVAVLCRRYAEKLRQLGVAEVEVKLTCQVLGHSSPLHIVASNPTGFVLRLDTYVEEDGEIVGDDERPIRIFRSVDVDPALNAQAHNEGDWDGMDVSSAYEVESKFAKKRAIAANSDCLYCYDYISLFEAAIREQWPAENSKRPARCVDFVELVVVPTDANEAPQFNWTAADHAAGLLCIIPEPHRPPGTNKIGMVAWDAVFKTPEYPNGRSVIIIANDITIKAGSFGTREDVLFDLASQYARSRGLPRLYLAANSGARIGLSSKVRDAFQIKWKQDDDPTLGFDYLYLNTEQHDALCTSINHKACEARIVSEPEQLPEAVRKTKGAPAIYRLTDVYGDSFTESDLGVENLRGSGCIAGESSRAYRDIFTLTLVVGRSVGIGAYLVRLGHRTIQRAQTSPIILTGYQALNKLLGRNVYTSNDQLGGAKEIMYPNGVTHLVAIDHIDVVRSAIKWLSYVPERRGSPLPIITSIDPTERPILWRPKPNTPYDPRLLLAGSSVKDAQGVADLSEINNSNDENAWIPGFFDKDTLMETLAGWAKTVVVGRARLGGIPVGFIVTENRTAEAQHPADPADPTSSEKVTNQAGMVWFPDSAHKTAQAISDFSAEDLPLFIFANWRGFSGGQRDMFDEILKFGAHIVDKLVAFSQPVFIYIPPLAELRGGAWVVIDPTINLDIMEMYAADTARGGVLEPQGIVEIKFREKDLKNTMHRLDNEIIRLDAQIAEARREADSGREAKLRARVDAREKLLLPVYTSVAVHFADMHDTPGRMTHVGAIRAEVPWRQARAFFYHRLQRRLAEFEARNRLVSLGRGSITPRTASAQLRDTALAAGIHSYDSDDKAATAWLKSAHHEKIQLETTVATAGAKNALYQIINSSLSPTATANALFNAISSLPDAERQSQLKSAIKKQFS